MASLPPRPASAAIQGRSSAQRPVRPSSATQYRDAINTSDSSEVQRPPTYADVGERHHRSIVQLLRDKKKEHIDVSLHPAAAAASPPSRAVGKWSAQYADVNSTSNVSAPYFADLMHECRKRKLGRVHSENIQINELRYRESCERSWFQGWWFLWQHVVAQYIDTGARMTAVNQQMSAPRAHHGNRRTILRKDLARSLEKLSRATHLAQRFVFWLQRHINSREKHLAEDIRNASGLAAHGRSDTPVTMMNASNITTAGSDASGRTPAKFRGYVTDDPWSPTAEGNTPAAKGDGTVPPTRSGLGATRGLGMRVDDPAQHMHADSSDANGLSASSARESYVTGSGATSPQRHQNASGSSDRLDVFGTTTAVVHSDTTLVAGHAPRSSELSSAESIVIDAVMRYSVDLTVRHLNKLCKVAQREENVLRRDIFLQSVRFTETRNIEIAWMMSKLRAFSLLHQFNVAATELLESSLRLLISMNESSDIIDVVVHLKLEHHRLLSGEGVLKRQLSPVTLPAAVPISAVSTCGVVLVTSPPGSPLVSFMITSPEDSVLQASPAATAPPVLMYQLPPDLLREFHEDKRLYLIQKVGRGLLARINLFRHRMFWAVDRGIRKELQTAYTQGLMVLAGKLARLIESTRQRTVSQTSSVLLIQRVCHGFASRKSLKSMHVFWQVDTSVRVELFDAWRRKATRLASLCQLSQLDVTHRVELANEEIAARARLMLIVSSHGAQQRSGAFLQRSGRAFLARKHLYRLFVFWGVDARIRSETFAAWLSKADSLQRSHTRNSVRLFEREGRNQIAQAFDAQYDNIVSAALSAPTVESTSAEHNADSVSLIQRIGRAYISRKQHKGMMLFWRADSKVRSEVFAAWYYRVGKLAYFCTASAHLVYVEEVAARAALLHAHAEQYVDMVASAKSAEVLQKQLDEENHLWALDTALRIEYWNEWHHNCVCMRQGIDVAINEDVERAILLTGAFCLDHLREQFINEHPKARPSVEASNISGSDVDVSSDDEDIDDGPPNHNDASPALLNDRAAPVISQGATIDGDSDADVSTDENNREENSDADVSSDEEHGVGGVRPVQKEDTIDVSSDDDDADRAATNAAHHKAIKTTTDDNEEEVDVSSNDEDKQRVDVLANTMAPAVEVAQSDSGSTVVVASDDSDDSDDDVDVSDDDDDDSSTAETAVRLELSTRYQLQEHEGRDRVVLKKRFAAELEAIKDISDDDDDSGSSSFHIESPQPDGDLATPAKSNHTHRPQSKGKHERDRGAAAIAQNNNISKQASILSRSVTSQSGDLHKNQSTSSSVTLLLRHSTSGAQHDDSVEIVTGDSSSIDVTSDDDDGSSDEEGTQPVPARSHSIRDTYLRIFANERARLEGQEYSERYDISRKLDELQLSLLGAQEYLARHSTVVVARNRFIRSMLDTKLKLTEMAKYQLNHANSRLGVNSVRQHPPPRGSVARTRSNSSEFSLASGGPSPDSTTSKNNSMVIGNASLTSILRDETWSPSK